jgi:hypothetical protein
MKNNAPISQPTLTDVLEATISSFLGGIHTAFPGNIESYEESSCKASIQPLIARKFDDESTLQFPLIPDVPIVWPRTKLGSISFPLSRGDGVLVICSERSLDEWLAKGSVVAPEDKRRFSLIDAIAIPGLFSFNEVSKISDNTSFQIHFNNQKVRITNNGSVEIGSAPLQSVMTAAYKTALELQLGLIATALNTLGQPIAPFVPPANGLTSKVTLE